MCNASCNAESINYGDFGFYTPFTGETISNKIACAAGTTTGSAFARTPASDFGVSLIAFDSTGNYSFF